MRLYEKWTTDFKSPVWCIGLPNDSDLVIVPELNVIKQVGLSSGEVVGPKLKVHKAPVLAVAYSSDGSKFASSDRSGLVVVWKCSGEGLVKYAHTSAVRSIAFDPLNHVVASGSAGEIGLWHPEKKIVEKIKTPSAVWTLKWTTDGIFLLVGFADGSISKYDRSGSEKFRINNSKCLCWALDVLGDTLVAGMWNLKCVEKGGTVEFINITSFEIFSRFSLDSYQPTSVVWVNANIALVGTTRGSIELVSRENGHLMTLHSNAGEKKTWITCLALVREQILMFGTSQGSLACMRLAWPTVHAVHKDLYAARDQTTLTDVILSHSESRLKIVTKNFISSIGVYHEKLACESNGIVSIYALKTGCLVSHFKLDRNHNAPILLLLAELHVLICSQSSALRAYTLTGRLEKEVVLPSQVRYAKVVDGPPGKESILIGCSDGRVLMVFLGQKSSNTDPTTMIIHGSGIRCLDLSLNKCFLALVDDLSNLSVYSVKDSSILLSVPNIVSACFNITCPPLLALTDSAGVVHLVDIRIPDIFARQEIRGTVLSHRLDNVSLVHEGAFHSTIPVDTSALRAEHATRGDFQSAFSLVFRNIELDDLERLTKCSIDGAQPRLACKLLARNKSYKQLLSLSLTEISSIGS